MKKYALIYSFIIFFIAGCANQNGIKNLNGMFYTNISQMIEVSSYNTSTELESIKSTTSSFMDDYVKPEDRLKIDFPFSGSLLENYEKTVEYIKDGRPDYFKSQGIISWLGEDDSKNEISTILEINFIYRNDGTLFYEDYNHNGFVFGTTNCGMNIYYDELQRIKYESNYITHGTLEYYYIFPYFLKYE